MLFGDPNSHLLVESLFSFGFPTDASRVTILDLVLELLQKPRIVRCNFRFSLIRGRTYKPCFTMSDVLILYKVLECPSKSHGKWLSILENRLSGSRYRCQKFRNKIQIWDISLALKNTSKKEVSFRDGIEISRVSMRGIGSDTLIGFNFCRLFFKEGESSPTRESTSILFNDDQLPQGLLHLPLLPEVRKLITFINEVTPIISHVQNLDYTSVAPQIGLKFATTSTTLYEQSAHGNTSYSSNLLKYIRNERAESPKNLELALITLFSDNEKESLEYAKGVSKILNEEWGCMLSKVHISGIETLKGWVKSEADYPKIALLALDGKAGERPSKEALSWIHTLKEQSIDYVIFNAMSDVSLTNRNHGTATHLLSKLGGYHYHTVPESVPDLPEHWCIGLDLGYGALSRAQAAIITLTDGKGRLKGYWRAIKDVGETLSPDILKEGMTWIVSLAEEIDPGKKFLAFRDGGRPRDEPLRLYEELLPHGRSTLIEYAKRGNPMMLNDGKQPAPGTFCTTPESPDTFLFAVQSPLNGSLTKTVKFFTDHNELEYSKQQIGEILIALCFAPKLSFQPSRLPAPIYWADGLASVSGSNLKFGGWSTIPSKTVDFRTK